MEAIKARITAHEMLSIVLPKDSNAWVAMFKAYLDDTGNERFAGYGGFVAPAAAWKAIEPEWLALNDQHCIAEFHAKSYPNLIPAYADLAHRFDLRLIGCTIDRASYRSYTHAAKRHSFGLNEYASSAESCALRIFQWLQGSPDEQCAVIIECQTNYVATVSELIYQAADSQERNPLLSLTTINKKNKAQFPMREVADLGANLTAKHTAARHYGERVELDLSEKFDGKRNLGIQHFRPCDIEILFEQMGA